MTKNHERFAQEYECELRSNNFRAALKRILRDMRFDRVIISAIESNSRIAPATIASMVAAYKRKRLEYAASVTNK